MSKQLLDTDSKHSFSVSALADALWNRATEAAFRTGWAPATRLCESAVVALMQRIAQGRLRVLTFSNIYNFPASSALIPYEADSVKHKAELRVINDSFWIRLAAMGDLGFAEAYMYGDVECDDLVSLFHVSTPLYMPPDHQIHFILPCRCFSTTENACQTWIPTSLSYSPYLKSSPHTVSSTQLATRVPISPPITTSLTRCSRVSVL